MTPTRRYTNAAGRLALIPLVLLSACFTSPTPRRAAARDTNRGETVTLHLTDGTSRAGELLGWRESSLMALVGGRVAHLAIADIVYLTPTRNPTREIGLRTREERGDVARMSRFPFGISPTVLTALLAENKQQSADSITMRPR